MPWWGWVVFGAVLLGAELFVSTQFYLVIFGTAAFTVGLVVLVGLGGPIWVQWGLFGVLCVVFIVAFRRRVWSRVAPGDSGAEDGLVGEVAVSRERIPPGARGSAELHGSVWTVKNVGETSLDEGTRAQVERVSGLVLEVRRENLGADP